MATRANIPYVQNDQIGTVEASTSVTFRTLAKTDHGVILAQSYASDAAQISTARGSISVAAGCIVINALANPSSNMYFNSHTTEGSVTWSAISGW